MDQAERAVVEEVDDHLRAVIVRLSEGWAPSFSGPFPDAVDFVWDGRDLSPGVGSVKEEDGELLVEIARDAGDLLPELSVGGLRNKKCDGRLADGAAFDAEISCAEFRSDGVWFSCNYWHVCPPTVRPRLWVAHVRGGFSLSTKGNVEIHRCSIDDGGVHKVSRRCGGIRLRGHYTYFLVPGKGADERYLLVDIGSAPRPTREALTRDTMVLQFLNGGALAFGTLVGLGDDLSVVARAGLRLDAAPARGEIKPSVAQDAPPLGIDASTPWAWAWTVTMFELIASLEQQNPKRFALFTIMSFYLSAIEDAYVEGKALKYYVAMEGLAKRMVTAAELHRSRNHDDWLAWCEARDAEIAAHEHDDYTGRLRDAVRRADELPATRVVRVALEREPMPIRLPSKVRLELDARHKLVHEAMLPMADAFDVDDYVRHQELPRSVLVALLAKLVGYRGPIAGYAYDASGKRTLPAWWTADSEPPREVTRLFRATACADVDSHPAGL